MVKIFSNSQEAWEGINEYMFIHEADLERNGQGRDGNVSVMYDNIIHIVKPRVDPNFNFARMFNYRKQKWTSLVGNYVDLERLKEIKVELTTRTQRKNRLYQVTKHFKNTHKNGKDCLISVTFCKRKKQELPTIIFHTRTVEATKRMLMDFLLVQRIGEYIYGKYKFHITCYFPCIVLNAEAFTMYHTHRNLKGLLRKNQSVVYHPQEPFQKIIMNRLDKFLTVDPMSIGYKSHRRAAKQLQVGKDGIPYSGEHFLLAKDLKLKV